MSSDFSAEDVTQMVLLLSRERLQPFRDLTASDIDAIELHRAAMQLNMALVAVAALTEIALRNAVHCHLSRTLGTEDWLRNPPEFVIWQDTEREGIERAERQARRETSNSRGESVSQSQIITRLTLHFWKRLFAGTYQRMLWRSIRGVFPNKTCRRATIAGHLEVLHKTRNRLAHHEFVNGQRLEETLHSLDYISGNLGPRRAGQASALSNLLQPQRLALDEEAARFEEIRQRLQVADGRTGSLG